MSLLPASGLLSPPFAHARRAHPATGRPALASLSPGAAHHRGGRRALEAGALEHLLAEGLREVREAVRRRKFRRLRRAQSNLGRRRMALMAPSRSRRHCGLTAVSVCNACNGRRIGYMTYGRARGGGIKRGQKKIIAPIERSRRALSNSALHHPFFSIIFDFCPASNELARPRCVHQSVRFGRSQRRRRPSPSPLSRAVSSSLGGLCTGWKCTRFLAKL